MVNDNNNDDNDINNDKVILAIGQDLFSIQEYVTEQYNYTIHDYIAKHNATNTNSTTNVQKQSKVPTYKSTIPSVVMFYTDMQTLNGLLYTPVDYGSGIEYTNGLLDTFSFPNNNHNKLSIQIGLWLNGTIGCTDIISKQLDSNLYKMFTYLTNEKRIETVYLRVGYEFDNPSFGYSTNPTLYKHTFQYIVNYYNTNFIPTSKQQQQKQKKKKKIQFVWHSWGQGQLPINTTLYNFYPGYQYVDWIGISIFTQVYKNSFSGTIQDIQNVLNFAHTNNHTNIMIAESTPFGGVNAIDTDNVSTKQQQEHNEIVLSDQWNNWFIPVLQLLHNTSNHIKMWSYINCNWDTQPMWYNVGFGDTRISSNKTIQYLWNTNIIQNTKLFIINNEQNNNDDDNDNDLDAIKSKISSSSPVKNRKNSSINSNKHHSISFLQGTDASIQTFLLKLPFRAADQQQQQQHYYQQRINNNNNNNNNNMTTGSNHIPFDFLFMIVVSVILVTVISVVVIIHNRIMKLPPTTTKTTTTTTIRKNENNRNDDKRNNVFNNDNTRTIIVITNENTKLIG